MGGGDCEFAWLCSRSRWEGGRGEGVLCFMWKVGMGYGYNVGIGVGCDSMDLARF